MNGMKYRCGECREKGKERIYATMDGYKNHLREYHGAAGTDLVQMKATEQAPTNGNRNS